jgi:hypothetical protein
MVGISRSLWTNRRQQSDPLPSVPAMEETRAQRIAAVHRELAELTALNGAVEDGLQMRVTRTAGPSVVYSIRLDRGELMALERRAFVAGIRPTVLARNLIRIGLTKSAGCDVVDAVERVSAAVEELRALVASSPMRSIFD